MKDERPNNEQDARRAEKEQAKRQTLDDRIAEGQASIEQMTQSKHRVADLLAQAIGQRASLQSEAIGKVVKGENVTKDAAQLVQVEQLIVIYGEALEHLNVELKTATDQTQTFQATRSSMGQG